MIDTHIIAKYGGVFTALVGAGFGLPIPEELPIVTAGGLVGGDPELRWYIMLPLCIFGVVVADTVLYTFGRVSGPTLLEKPWVQRRLITPKTRRRIEKNFHAYGIWILVIARLLPGIRSPIFIMSGVMRVPVAKFILADSIYAVPGVSLLFWLSYFFTDQLKAAVQKVDDLKPFIVTAFLGAAGGALIYSLARRRVSTGDPKDVPLFGKTLSELLPHEREELKRRAEAGEDVGVPHEELFGRPEDNGGRPGTRVDL